MRGQGRGTRHDGFGKEFLHSRTAARDHIQIALFGHISGCLGQVELRERSKSTRADRSIVRIGDGYVRVSAGSASTMLA